MTACWLYQKLISLRTDVGEALPPRVERHLRCCPACRQFQQTHAALGRQLRAQAGVQRQPAPPFLRARVLAAIERLELNRQPRRLLRPAWAGGLALAASAALLAFMLLRQPPAPPGASKPVSPPTPVLAATLPQVPLPDGGRLMQMSELLDRSLEAELQSVINDATNVVSQLAQSFLPAGAK
jgi:hypothetical protein